MRRQMCAVLCGLLVFIFLTTRTCRSPLSAPWKVHSHSIITISHSKDDTIPRNLPVDLTQLHLRYNQIKLISKESFIQLNQLNNLQIAYNPLTEIQSKAFSSLSNLKKLTLSCSEYAVKEFPNNNYPYPKVTADVFLGLEKLTFLSLQIMGIKNLSRDFFQNVQNLHTLMLRRNPIQNITMDAFDLLENLEILDLSFTFITELHPQSFRKLTKLKTLNLSPTRLHTVPSDALSNLISLQFLNIGGNFSTIKFEESIRKLALRKVVIRSMYTKRRRFDLKILKGTFSIRTLVLSNTGVSTVTADKWVDFWDNSLNSEWAEVGLKFPKLRKLFLSETRISYLSSTVFDSIPMAEELHLEGNELTHLDMSQFSNLTHLRHLDMSRNKIVTINGSSWYLPNLTTLLLSRNGIVSIPESFLGGKFLPSLQWADLQRLPFSCDCQLSWFRKWADSDKIVVLEGFNDYHCSSSTDKRVSFVKDFNPWTLDCESHLTMYISIDLSCVVVVLAIVSAVCMYYRFFIKYACFVVKLKVTKEIMKSISAHQYKNHSELSSEFIITLKMRSQPCAVLCGLLLFMCVTTCTYGSPHISPWKVYSHSIIAISNSKDNTIPRDLPVSLTQLHLRYNQIKLISNESFLQLKQLTHLQIAYNPLREIRSKAFSSLSTLKNLTLSCSEYAVKEFPNNNYPYPKVTADVFLGLEKLTFLSLQIMGIKNVSQDFFQHVKTLRTLKLRRNPIQNITMDAFDLLENLEILDLSFTFITELHPQSFRKLTKLKTLYLSPTRLHTIPSDALSHLICLRFLRIGGNFSTIKFEESVRKLVLQKVVIWSMYTKSEFEYIKESKSYLAPDAFKHLSTTVLETEFPMEKSTSRETKISLFSSSLKQLTLSLKSKCLREAENIINALPNNVTELNLSNNKLKSINNTAFRHLQHLRLLNLSSNALHWLDKDTFVGLKKLQILDLSDNPLDSTALLSLHVFSNSDYNLKMLNISKNLYMTCDSDSIFESVFNISTLRELVMNKMGLRFDDELLAISLCNIPNLQDLKLQHNNFFKFSLTCLMKLQSLRSLDLSNSEVNPTGIYYHNFMFSKLPDLQHLDLSGRRFDLKVLKGTFSLRTLVLSNTGVSTVTADNWEDFWDNSLNSEWAEVGLKFPKLRKLFLSDTRISYLSSTVFDSIPMAEELHLQENGLTHIDMSQFSNLTHLRYLDMSGNKIVTINGSSWYLPNLTTLLLARNGIVSIPESFLGGKFLPSLRWADLRRLPFSCDCQLSWFRKWAENDKIVMLDGFNDYHCSSSTDKQVSFVKNFNPWTLDCDSHLTMYVSIALSCVAVVLAIVSALCVYNRWYIKYACFVVKLKVRGYREIVDLEEKQKKYDAFVSYNSKDENFVQNELLGHLETKFSICVDFKHFIPGKSIIDNIIDCIQDSRKTILLLTPNFVKSEWCYFEMEMALHRLFDEGRDVVVLVLLEPIPERDLPRRLRKLFTKKTFIEWPKENNPTARQLFWAKLEDAIQVPGKVDRLNKHITFKMGSWSYAVLPGLLVCLSMITSTCRSGSAYYSHDVAPWKVYNHSIITISESMDDIIPRNLPVNLTQLHLHSNQIRLISAESFKELKQLKILQIDYNPLTEIGRQPFANLSNLESLSLGCSKQAVKEFPNNNYPYPEVTADVFHGLEKLTYLSLEIMGIKKVERDFFQHVRTLRTLLLRRNPIQNIIIGSFDLLENLEKLDLSFTFITELHPQSFRGLTKLKTLYLSPTKLHTIPSDALSNLINLRVLFVGGNFSMIKFEEPVSKLTLRKVLVRSMYTISEFEYIKESESYLAPDAFQHLNTGLLMIEQFPIQKAASNETKQHLFSSSLQLLAYFSGFLPKSLCVKQEENIIKALPKNITLLNLSNNKLKSIGSTAFRHLQKLRLLNLTSNALYMLERDTFLGLKKLQVLDLSDNRLDSTALASLYVFSQSDYSLKILNISKNTYLICDSDSVFESVFNIATLRELVMNKMGLKVYDELLTISLCNIPNLHDLKLKGNTFSKFSLTCLMKLQSLTSLDLSNSEVHPTGVYYDDFTFSELPNLEYLDLSGRRFDLKVLQNASSIKTLVLTNREVPSVTTSIWVDFWDNSLNSVWADLGLKFPKLCKLFLSDTHISYLSSTVFDSIPMTEELHLERNDFTYLDMSQFGKLTHLRYLDMSGNKIVTINGSSWYLPNLTTLLLARNGIVSIPESFLGGKFLPSLRFVDFKRLPFSCDCKLSWFRKWADSDNIVALEGFNDYHCSSSTDKRVSYLKDFNPWNLNCGSHLAIYISVTLSCVAVVLTIVSAVCVYNRWYIKYTCFVFQMKVRGYRQVVDLEEQQKKFDAFLAYNSKDADVVQGELLDHLETKFSICVHFKHFIPGKSIIDNIIECIQDSRKTILLLTPNFVKSEWCYFEMEMALHQLFDEGRDVIVLVLLEPIPEKDLPRRLRKLFAKKTFIEWPKEHNQIAEQLFWAKLEHAIKVPGKVDRLHEV
ncbi:uncharacterized protein [Ptychodera flava]|uniref:uncharacterized protein n=1 Tax=Ptychodera flava TaxID=63121 RepID=UPI00396A9E16